MPETRKITFNGIHEDTGSYLIPPLTPAELAMAAFGKPEEDDEDHRADLETRKTKGEGDLGVKAGVVAENLASAGWGVIFAAGTPPEVVEALEPLLEQRKKDAGKLFRRCDGAESYQHKNGRGESKPLFLRSRNAATSGDVDPVKMPYYLLLVGSPEEIPFTFQYQLDVQYAVGRIHFDKPEEYFNYAQSVVASENGKLNLPNRAVFFGPANPNDDSTARSSQHLISPLAQLAAKRKDAPAWTIDKLLPEQSTRARLARLLGGDDTPGFLFTASHGMGGYKLDDPRIFSSTGALTCQDWGGPGSTGRVRDTFFAAEDLSSDAKLAGLIAMVFACYGGGCPEFNNFFLQDGFSKADRIAPKPFLSALPKRMLSHPKGGALAVIAHVDRVWDCSFLNVEQQQRELATFESMLKLLLEGKPVGLALERLNTRYAEIASDLATEMQIANELQEPQNKEVFAELWTSTNDARNYMVLGDPAVRLRLGEAPADPRVVEMPKFGE
ncbi:MAG: hypothetical protein JNL98_17115 [Bryobacterales bacterium]|nr:hypothetical protein [Bryobacterales bacterium]